jgi:hypothetical protein
MSVPAILASMRVHLDVTSGPLGRDAGIERVLALGARRVDLGQSGKPRTAPADPEGNEFCVIRPKTMLIR